MLRVFLECTKSVSRVASGGVGGTAGAGSGPSGLLLPVEVGVGRYALELAVAPWSWPLRPGRRLVIGREVETGDRSKWRLVISQWRLVIGLATLAAPARGHPLRLKGLEQQRVDDHSGITRVSETSTVWRPALLEEGAIVR